MLAKGQIRFHVRTYSLSQRTINVWNTFSSHCVHASSVNILNIRIDKHLIMRLDKATTSCPQPTENVARMAILLNLDKI